MRHLQPRTLSRRTTPLTEAGACVALGVMLAALSTACGGGGGSSEPVDDPSLGGQGPGGGGTGSAQAGTGGSGGGAGSVATPDVDPPSLEELAEMPSEAAPWTILVYGHADHNLSYNLLADMEEMAAAELGSAVNLVVLADWDSSQLMAGVEPPTYYPDGVQLFRVPGAGGELEVLAQGAETNLDDPLALASLVRDVFSALPSERRGLILWDHGGAWAGGFGGDTQNGTTVGSPMSAQLVAEAIGAGLEAAGITEPKPLDFIAFDTCLMAGAEVAFPFRGLTDIYIAAAEIDYGAGWDYAATMTHFARNPNATMAELAAAEVSHWDAHHATQGPNDALLRSHAALDLSQIDAFANATSNLMTTMTASTTFDPLELGRSAFFALAPYSSVFEGGSSQPGLRDIGQVLSALATAQSDASVALAAGLARQALDELVLASSQGALRAGAQVGLHVDQTLGSQLTAERLDAYRLLASEWVDASRWDELLSLASASADTEAPLFQHGVVNGEGASREAPPLLQFITEDPTVAKAAVYAAAQAPDGSVLTLGLVGAGLVEANTPGEFAWDGTVVGFSDGQPAMLDIWLDAPAGQESILRIDGFVGGISAEPLAASLVFGAAQAVADAVVLFQVGQGVTVSTAEIAAAAPGATFTPAYFSYGAAPEPQLVTGTPLPVPSGGFELYSTYLQPGSYFLMTAVTDIWGNEGLEVDPVTLLESLGP